MRSLKLGTLAIASSCFLSACGGMSGSNQAVAFGSKSSDGMFADNSDLSCLTNKVDYVLDTNVLDFEMQGGGGLNVGYSPVGSTFLAGISLGVNYSRGQIDTQMVITDPLKPGVPVTSAEGTASNNNMSLALTANLTMATFGPSFWYSTPIYTLSNDVLQNNLANVGTNLAALVKTDWWSTVAQTNGDAGVFIPVGSAAGIQAGDTFNVMDVTYEWAGNGTPCASELIMPLVNSSTPKAVLKATTVAVDYTYLTYVSMAQPVSVHDYVKIAKLVQPAPAPCTNLFGIGCSTTSTARTTLARSIRLGSLSSQPLSFVGQNNAVTTINIAPFVNAQLQTLLPQQAYGGFYIHQ